MAEIERGAAGGRYDDAVLVMVRKATGRTVADVIGPSVSKRGIALTAVAEFPLTVAAAVKRAREMAAHSQADRVVIVAEADTIWRDDWLTLR